MSLSNSRCRFFEMKNIISKGHLFWKEGDQVPSPDYGLKFPTKVNMFIINIKELTLVLRAGEH